MLQKLNERIQGLIAWVVIILIAVTFMMFGVDYYMQSRQVSDVEVSVNGEDITKQAYEINYRRIRQQHQNEPMTAANDSALKKQALEDMIVNLTTVQSARNNGFLVSNEEANSAIVNIPQFQQDGQFSAQRYQQALNGAMYTPESFQNQVRQGMLLNQQRFAFMGSSFALSNEIQRFVKLYMQTRDYAYLIIPSQQFLQMAKINPTDIMLYYDKHKQDFVEPEKVGIEYIRLSMKQIKEKTKVTDEDIQRYYQENEASFLTPSQWQVAHIFYPFPEDASIESEHEIKQKAYDAYKLLQKNPEQFDELVKKMSANGNAGTTDGVLPWIVAGTTQYDKALSRLIEPGEIAYPIRTANGYEIFKLVAYKKAELKPFNEVKQEISNQLSAELTQAHYAQALEQLTDLSYQTPDSLAPVAQTLKLPIEKTPVFSRDDSQFIFAQNKQVINAAFSHDVLDLGNNSEPIQLDNDSVIVLRVNKHIAASSKKLADVEQEIRKKLLALQARLGAEQFGMALLDTSNNAKEVEMIKQHKLEWHNIDNAARDSDASDGQISEIAFNLPRVDSRAGGVLSNGDYVVVRLNKVRDGQYQSLDKEQQASLIQQIEASYGVMDYDLYVHNLVANAKIDRK